MNERTSPVASQPPDDKECSSDTPEEHYAAVIGMFRNNPMLDAMMANIRERRREINTDERIA